MTSAATERAALCDLFDDVGPDAPTLCTGWTTRDLAAHLVVRERRPDGAIGILVKPFAAHGEKVRLGEAAKPWADLVEAVRTGPPIWSPTRIGAVDRAANTVEFFVHHEDVRRAQPGWEARPLDEELAGDLAGALGRMARALARRSPVGLTLVATGSPGGPIVARRGEPMVTVSGPIGELTLLAYGRGDHARVDFDGLPEAVAALQSASLGL